MSRKQTHGLLIDKNDGEKHVSWLKKGKASEKTYKAQYWLAGGIYVGQIMWVQKMLEEVVAHYSSPDLENIEKTEETLNMEKWKTEKHHCYAIKLYEWVLL